jgi:hypothetical protein
LNSRTFDCKSSVPTTRPYFSLSKEYKYNFKNSDVFFISYDLSECKNFVSAWKTWAGGATGTIVVHRETDPDVNTWAITLEFDRVRPASSLQTKPVFPKVRSAEHFWSARTIYLVREKRNNTYLKPINY